MSRTTVLDWLHTAHSPIPDGRNVTTTETKNYDKNYEKL